MRRLTCATVVLLALPAAARAQSACESVAGNLVVNCGFEDGSEFVGGTLVPTGYTVAGPTATAVPFEGAAHSGAYGLLASGGVTLSQALATAGGQQYRVRLFARNGSPVPGTLPGNEVEVRFGGVLIGTAALPGADFQEFTFTGAAAGASTVLALTSRNVTSVNFLDDLSVTALPAVVTPEPATWALVGAGLAGVAAVARRRTA